MSSGFDIRQGDVRELLRAMPDEFVNCVVTSPPYYGLRDYGTGVWEGGVIICDHKKVSPGTASLSKSTLGPNRDGVSGQATNGHQQEGFRSSCGKCGAVRVDKQIGMEETPELFIATLVDVFRDVRRVLRSDGTLWLNIGDSYTSGGRTWRAADKKNPIRAMDVRPNTPEGLKPKDLIGVPWMLAFALRADGWYLRSEIIWHKPNPMPESVTDRPTKAHEQVFLFSKSARYSYNADAIAEPLTRPEEANRKTPARFGGADKWEEAQKQSRLHSGREYTGTPTGTRNKRSVWTLTAMNTKDAHFATFPIELPETCILAGCPEGGTVLDPFNGAGTTGLAALKHGRRYIGIELNPEYVDITMRRLDRHCPLLAAV